MPHTSCTTSTRQTNRPTVVGDIAVTVTEHAFAYVQAAAAAVHGGGIKTPGVVVVQSRFGEVRCALDRAPCRAGQEYDDHD